MRSIRYRVLVVRGCLVAAPRCCLRLAEMRCSGQPLFLYVYSGAGSSFARRHGVELAFTQFQRDYSPAHSYRALFIKVPTR